MMEVHIWRHRPAPLPRTPGSKSVHRTPCPHALAWSCPWNPGDFRHFVMILRQLTSLLFVTGIKFVLGFQCTLLFWSQCWAILRLVGSTMIGCNEAAVSICADLRSWSLTWYFVFAACMLLTKFNKLINHSCYTTNQQHWMKTRVFFINQLSKSKVLCWGWASEQLLCLAQIWHLSN